MSQKEGITFEKRISEDRSTKEPTWMQIAGLGESLKEGYYRATVESESK